MKNIISDTVFAKIALDKKCCALSNRRWAIASTLSLSKASGHRSDFQGSIKG